MPVGEVVDYIGKGVQFPFTISSDTGSIKTSIELDRIYQSIRQILNTPIGFRPMLPEFGCSINELVFEPLDFLLPLALDAIQTAIERWEKRVEIIRVSHVIEQERGRILFSIEFNVINSNVEGNLVYPFYLRDKE